MVNFIKKIVSLYKKWLILSEFDVCIVKIVKQVVILIN